MAVPVKAELEATIASPKSTPKRCKYTADGAAAPIGRRGHTRTALT